MADDRKYTGRHHISIDRRERVLITGIVEVVSFDDETIVCETEMGALILRGNNLHVSKLSLDIGELEVDGEIDNIGYEDDMAHGRGKSSLLSKIFK